jgi:hypothetical protein
MGWRLYWVAIQPGRHFSASPWAGWEGARKRCGDCPSCRALAAIRPRKPRRLFLFGGRGEIIRLIGRQRVPVESAVARSDGATAPRGWDGRITRRSFAAAVAAALEPMTPPPMTPTSTCSCTLPLRPSSTGLLLPAAGVLTATGPGVAAGTGRAMPPSPRRTFRGHALVPPDRGRAE